MIDGRVLDLHDTVEAVEYMAQFLLLVEGKMDQFLDTSVNEGLDTLLRKHLGNNFL